MRTALLLQSLVALAVGYASSAAAETPRPLQNLFTDIVQNAPPPANSVATPVKQNRPRAPHTIDLSLRKKIGQMILIGFPGTEPGEEWPGRVGKMMRDSTIGGVILFSQNVVDPIQLKRLTSSFEQKDRPPLICIDQEGGSIQRLTAAKGFVGLPSAQRMAAIDPAAAARLYRGAAQELAGLGINCNFGPVLDLNIVADNPAIGRLERSYSADAKTVIEYARLFIDAHRNAGILTAAKHFPGHGSARVDPHNQVVDITPTWKEIELEPFQAIIDDGRVSMIMVGHLILKERRFFDGDKPASLSSKAIQQELRTHYGFRGLVVSDDLDMDAIRSRYGIDEAAAMAIEAGSDLIIVTNLKMPDPEIANRIISKVMQAIDQGRIKRESIEQSYDRIMQSKKVLTDRRAHVMH
jgi:beta-N-acetylhexosaminidase